MTKTMTAAEREVREVEQRLEVTLGYAEAVERLRGCRRAVARAARALASGDARGADALDTWWQLERAQLAVVTRLQPAAHEARRASTGAELMPLRPAAVLRLRAA